MKSSTQDKVEGKLHQIKGSLKETVGKVTQNSELEVKGKIEKAGGKVQEKMGQVKEVVEK